jgi:hypothetical protein
MVMQAMRHIEMDVYFANTGPPEMVDGPNKGRWRLEYAPASSHTHTHSSSLGLPHAKLHTWHQGGACASTVGQLQAEGEPLLAPRRAHEIAMTPDMGLTMMGSYTRTHTHNNSNNNNHNGTHM